MATRIPAGVPRPARARREACAGPWLPGPLLTGPCRDPERPAELAGPVPVAALLLERLSPPGRAVLVPREVPGSGEIAAAGRPEAACRQLAVRARRHMDAAPPVRGRPPGAGETRRAVLRRARPRRPRRPAPEPPAAGVQIVADGGGKAPAPARSITGAEKAARVPAPVFPRLVRINVTPEPREVNGQPGAIVRDRDGKAPSTLAPDAPDGQIPAIRPVSSPGKPGHAGPVADARAAARKANQARRPAD